MLFRYSQKKVADLMVHTLTNRAISISIVPEFGGRLVSMRDRLSGREWLDGWAPASKRRLWHPSDPADYDTSPGAGLDECLPTVLPCTVNRKALPDHGELWNQQPDFDSDLATTGVFACRWNVKSLPLAFERRISLHKSEIRFDYRIENLSEQTHTPFLWAWHPLFSWKRGDQIRFPASVRSCLTPSGESLPWPIAQAGCDLSRAKFSKQSTPAAKVFIGPASKGGAAIHSSNGARLSLSWPTALIPYAGIWITRGFWQGLHHWAIEPTNAPVDRLADVANASSSSPTMLAPSESRNWRLTVKFSQTIPQTERRNEKKLKIATNCIDDF